MVRSIGRLAACMRRRLGLWLTRCGLLQVALTLVKEAECGPDNLAGAAVSAGGNLRIDEGLKFRRQGNVAGFALRHGAGELKQVLLCQSSTQGIIHASVKPSLALNSYAEGWCDLRQHHLLRVSGPVVAAVLRAGAERHNGSMLGELQNNPL